MAPSPIVELNRAVAVSMAVRARPALRLVDQLVETRTLERYHLLYSVRGDLLDRLGRTPRRQRPSSTRAATWPRTTPERGSVEPGPRVRAPNAAAASPIARAG